MIDCFNAHNNTAVEQGIGLQVIGVGRDGEAPHWNVTCCGQMLTEDYENGVMVCGICHATHPITKIKKLAGEAQGALKSMVECIEG